MPRGGARPNSGRPKGIPNRDRVEMIDLLQSHPLTKNFNPLISLAVIANGQIPETYDAFVLIIDLLSKSKVTKVEINKAKAIATSMTEFPVIGRDNIVTATKELVQYMYPKLKAIELSDPEGKNPFAALATEIAALTKANAK